MNKSDTIAKLAEALSAFQGEVKPAKKDATNPFFKSKYADLAGIWDVCRTPLSKHGLSVTQLPQVIEGNINLTTVLLHSSGEWIASDYSVTPVKNDPQGIGSALTYARRYAMSAILGIASEEDDDAEAALGRADTKKHISDAPQALTQPLKDKSSIIPPTEQHYCQVHDVAFKKMTKGDKNWWSHRLGDGSWCNEPKIPEDKPPDLLQKTMADLLLIKEKKIWTVDRMLEELAILGFEGSNVGETVKLLPEDKLLEFYDIIQEALGD